MKKCPSCDLAVSEKIITCPACGSHIVEGMKYIDDYRIQAIIHEGRSSIVCKAKKDNANQSVSIRVFTENSGVDEQVAQRLEKELKELKKLPGEHFIRHYSINQSRDGHWYRLSEWADATDWGSIFMSGLLHDQRKMVTLFHNIASVIDLLHKRDHFMPYLILDDILIPKKRAKELHVKINYKLSRFLDARATHHGPMLQKLLDCHPDIVNKRAIDFKSGIWSLGKIFVELLSADPNLKDFSSKIDDIKGLDPDLIILIKLMLSDDPGLRPQTMAKVVSVLSGILNRLPYDQTYNQSYDQSYNRRHSEETTKKPTIISELQWFKRVVVLLIFIILGIVGFGTVSWFKINTDIQKKDPAFSQFVESYAGSIAFVMVEYGLSASDKVIYKNKVEGTAFLADTNGYILTNRHVACPWLDDVGLFQAFNQAADLDQSVEFDYKIYLWFEGAKAFNRLLALKDSSETSDVYHLSSAYSTGGEGNLRIVGIPRTPVNTGQLIKSPFKNDFAVLKIDNLPSHLKPLPLESSTQPSAIKRLSPVVILGFPLGNSTQADYINTSITSGHVRRSTTEIIQVDTSIYSGNSGGPAIDAQGRVIGIASGVIIDSTKGYLKITTPLSDFGLVLPISRPAKLIESIKMGQPQWNGVIDFSLNAKLEAIDRLAVENKFTDAARLSETMLKKSNDPVLIYVTGMLNFCAEDYDKSRLFFKKLSQLEPENMNARLMLYILDWVRNDNSSHSFTKSLFTMEWHEDDEFIGYLARILRDKTRMSQTISEYENRSQKSWRLFIEGLILEKNNEMEPAKKMFKQSILNAHINDWVYYLSFSRLNHIQETFSDTIEDKTAHQKQVHAFYKQAKEYREAASVHSDRLNTLIDQSESKALDHDQIINIHNELLKLAPENKSIVGKIAFFHAAHGEWQQSIDFIDLFFAHPTRQTSLSLSLGLLKGQVLKIMGHDDQSKAFLEQFSKTIDIPWYRIMIKHLTIKPDEKGLVKLAGQQPEKLITLHTALGLLAEGRLDRQKAADHYREALSSYLDDWNEYNLAMGRIIAIRKALK
ncbi:MAG: trypsin-like peptidase domain-containing protein [Pseudomonadota bacterium]